MQSHIQVALKLGKLKCTQTNVWTMQGTPRKFALYAYKQENTIVGSRTAVHCSTSKRVIARKSLGTTDLHVSFWSLELFYPGVKQFYLFLGPTITEMGMNCALKIACSFQSPFFSLNRFFSTVSAVIDQSIRDNFHHSLHAKKKKKTNCQIIPGFAHLRLKWRHNDKPN